MRALWVALQFLTCFPVPRYGNATSADYGRSVLYYPLIGLFIGALLVAAAALLAAVDTMLAAALLLVIAVAVTGALHLDGLADTLDAWVGGYGDRERTLAIMKDPRRGSAAIVGVVLLLLLKYASFAVLLRVGEWPALLIAPVLARAALVFLFLTTPYVRAGGIGAAHATHLPRRGAIIVLSLTLLSVVLLDVAMALPLLVAGAVAVILRQMVRCRIGGSTGDTLGASCEIVEAAVLVTAALVFGGADG